MLDDAQKEAKLRELYAVIDVYEDELDHYVTTDERYWWLRREIKSLDREIAELVEENPEAA